MAENPINSKSLTPAKWFFFFIFTAFFIIDLCFVITGRLQALDDNLLALFINTRSDAFTVFFRAVTFCGDQTTVIVLCVIIIILPSRAKIGLPVALMTGVGTAVQSIIKDAVARPRPDMGNWLVGETDWLGFSFGYSFPSGHANASMIFWVALAILAGRVLILKGKPRAASVLRVVFFIFAVLIGISRLYLGVHYPSDVFGGWMLAGLLLIVFFALYKKFWPVKWRVILF